VFDELEKLKKERGQVRLANLGGNVRSLVAPTIYRRKI
jgi:hypothetical protein